MEKWIGFKGKIAADIGCGGGVYSKAMAESGARRVDAVDWSGPILQGAAENCAEYPQVRFSQGDAYGTGLDSSAYDVALERALVHHLFADCAQIGYYEHGMIVFLIHFQRSAP